ncbi:MAG: hypothetical protein CMC18_04030 [Flavobacteriaceae bacterium]|nr:hypothetical protein [Flavobacteriaceae bacterium]
MIQFCVQCEQELRGRIDKRFCSDSCRTQYHNEANRTRNQRFNHFHRQLKRNYAILKTFVRKGKSKVHLRELWLLGFDSTKVTGVKLAKTEKIIFELYDLTYRISDKNQIEFEKTSLTKSQLWPSNYSKKI